MENSKCRFVFVMLLPNYSSTDYGFDRTRKKILCMLNKMFDEAETFCVYCCFMLAIWSNTAEAVVNIWACDGSDRTCSHTVCH